MAIPREAPRQADIFSAHPHEASHRSYTVDHVSARSLAYAGALPFVIAGVLSLFGVPQLPFIGSVERMVMSYGLVIVCFMAGVHWGHFVSGMRSQVNLLIASNLVALTAWFGFLMLSMVWFCMFLIGLFLVLLVIDRMLASEARIGRDYLKMRTVVTLIVCLSLAVTAFA
jgi:hypothetical protein